MKRGWVGIVLLLSSDVWANAFGLYQNARSLSLGEAVTASSEGLAALFYNPAALAQSSLLTLHLASVGLEASQDLVRNYSALEKQIEAPGLPLATALLGQDLSARLQLSAGITLPSFGLAVIGDSQAIVRLQNAVYPGGIYGLMTTYGVQAGYGVSVLPARKKQTQLRAGIAFKLLRRAGAYTVPTLSDLLNLDISNLRQRYEGFSNALGVDLGLQLRTPPNRTRGYALGVSYLNLGNTTFAGTAEPLEGNLTLGAALWSRNAFYKLSLLYDFSQINHWEVNWKQKNHLGVELEFPFAAMRIGMNQLSLTYGIGAHLGPIRVDFASYAVQTLIALGSLPERRYVLSASLQVDP